LGKGSESEAIAEARAVLSIAGKRLLAFEIGNEPDLFSIAKHRKPKVEPTLLSRFFHARPQAEYSYGDWLAEYRRYKTALRARFPEIPLAGPDVAGSVAWATRFAADEGKDAVLLTHHYYRDGRSLTATIKKLLGHDPKLQPWLDQLSAASRSSGLPYRICEANTFWNGGQPGVSDTMASSLWVLDYMYTLAANGCCGVNLQTGVNSAPGGFISSYSPIGEDALRHYTAKPEYYGMLAFSLGGKGQLLETRMGTSAPELKAYATQSHQGAVTLTLLNKGRKSSTLTLDIGGRMDGGNASVIRLSAPAVDAKKAVTLGGAEVTSAGTWKSAKSEVVPVRNGKIGIKLPAFSAAVVQIV
jgi:hypothetical protein